MEKGCCCSSYLCKEDNGNNWGSYFKILELTFNDMQCCKSQSNKFPQKCATGKNTSWFAHQLNVRKAKLFKYFQDGRISNFTEQFTQRITWKLLLDLIVILMLSVIINKCWDLTDTVSVSKEDNFSFCSKLDKGTLDIIYNTTENKICYLENSKKISINYEIFSDWLNKCMHTVTISAFHITTTSVGLSTHSHNPAINLASTQIHSQNIPVTPTPPLPQVPNILLDNPSYDVTVYPPTVIGFQDQRFHESERNYGATLPMGFSASSFDVSESYYVTEPSMLYDKKASKPNCVHDNHEVRRHCTLCDLWVCTFCSRANFISTMGSEHLLLNQLQGRSSSHSVVLSNTGSSFCTSTILHHRNLVALELNWWQKNQEHEYVSIALLSPSSVVSWGRYNSGSDIIDIINSYNTLTCAISSVTSVLRRMTPAVTDTRFSFTSDPVMDYINNHCIIRQVDESITRDHWVIHTDALRALRETGTVFQNAYALRTLGQSYQTQLLKIQGLLPLLSLRGHVVGDDSMPSNRQYSNEESVPSNGAVYSEMQFHSLETEEVLTDHSMNRDRNLKGQKFQQKTSSGFQRKTAGLKKKGDEIHTNGEWNKYSGHTNKYPNQRNPDCTGTSPSYTGGARPKTSKWRRRSHNPRTKTKT